MAYTAIDDPEAYFQVKTYSGNDSARSITFDGDTDMQPDLMWLKSRTHTASWLCNDAVRGATKRLKLDLNSAEATETDMITAFNTDGFSLGTTTTVNGDGENFCSWSWKANGSGSSNSDGSVTSTVSANTTNKFSIAKYTGTGSAGATIGHGLGVKPDLIIIKHLSGSNWVVKHKSLGFTNNDAIKINLSNAAGTDHDYMNSTEPTTAIFYLNDSGAVNTDGNDHIAYCFTEVQGFSKFGSYIGNGDADGTFVYTGFRPALLIIKNTSSSSTNWTIIDNKMNPFNQMNIRLTPNSSEVEQVDSNPKDFLSNGFKLRTTGSYENDSGDSYIYMAFAEAPFVNSNGVPCNAR